jgi:ketosteroid isomerase-like protein
VVTDQIRTDLEQFYAAVDANEFAAAARYLSEDVDWIWGGVPQSGRAGVQQFIRAARLLAGRRHHITAFTENNGTAAAELSVTGVHSGPLNLPTGSIPATGKDLNISACHFVQTDADGRFQVSHVYIDFVSLLAQVLSATN